MDNNQQTNWNKYLPSSHFVIIVVCVAILGGIVFGVRTLIHHFQKKQFVAQTGIQPMIKVGDLVTQDTDGDGIADWEEPLWGLDPKNTDTNGDGISDGDEIRSKKIALNPEIKAEDQTQLNDTAKFAQDLFTTITTLSQNGLLTDASVANLASTLGDQITTKDIPDIISQNDLSITTTSKESIRTYQRALSKVILKYPTETFGTELEIIAGIFNTNDTSGLSTLKQIADYYESFSVDLKTLTVPAEIADEHAIIINTAHRLSVGLADIGAMIENPIVSLSGFIIYTKESVTFINTLEDMNTYFQKNGILN